MTIDASNIVEASNIMFSILKSSMNEINDKNEELTKISVKEKVRADKNEFLGQVINMYV